MRRYLCLALSVLTLAATASLAGPNADKAKKLYEKVTPSLVAVQYLYDGEFGRREFVGGGLVIGEEGLVMAPLALFPPQFPDEQMKEFKILIPGDEEKELEAEFLGRDERCEMAFLKTKEPQKWPAVHFEEVPVNVGDTIRSVGLLSKDAGFKSYYTECYVSTTVRGPIPHVLVSADGLPSIGSPVFNDDGKAIGMVESQVGNSVLLNDIQQATANLKSPPRYFVPARDFLDCLKEIPKAGEPLKIPWLGAGLTGLKKEVAEMFKLTGKPAALVSEVIPNSPAEKAGLKTGDKILTMNGEILERGDEPDETPMIMMRKIRRQKEGEKVTFGVLREKDKPPVEMTVTLEAQPRQAHQVKRYMADELGFSVREIVFADTYSRKIAADTLGVVVAFVKKGASAESAHLGNGDLITKINGTAVKDLEQFKKFYEDCRKDKPKDSVVLEVMRERNTEIIRIEPPQ